MLSGHAESLMPAESSANHSTCYSTLRMYASSSCSNNLTYKLSYNGFRNAVFSPLPPHSRLAKAGELQLRVLHEAVEQQTTVLGGLQEKVGSAALLALPHTPAT